MAMIPEMLPVSQPYRIPPKARMKGKEEEKFS